jgi:hypothetical protein
MLGSVRKSSVAAALFPPRFAQGGPGKASSDSISRSACPAHREFPGYFLVVETQKKERGMRSSPTILGQLLKPIDRRQFTAIVERRSP